MKHLYSPHLSLILIKQGPYQRWKEASPQKGQLELHSNIAGLRTGHSFLMVTATARRRWL